MPNKLTGKEIVKGLECCSIEHACSKCPYARNKGCSCINGILKDALDLINRKDEELNRLQARVEKCEKVEHFADKTIATLQAENERLIEEVAKVRRKALLEAFSKFAGHSDYHGDTILCKLKCMAEGKEVGNAKPLDTSKIKAKAYKEFAERVHCHCQSIINQEWNKTVSPVSWTDAYEQFDDEVDNLLKEMESE